MSVKKVNYLAKARGALFTFGDANELKDAININADELISLQAATANSISLGVIPTAVTIGQIIDTDWVVAYILQFGDTGYDASTQKGYLLSIADTYPATWDSVDKSSLPSVYVMQRVFQNKAVIGMRADLYWCSDEYDGTRSYLYSMSTAYSTIDDKVNSHRLRQFRTFSVGGAQPAVGDICTFSDYKGHKVVSSGKKIADLQEKLISGVNIRTINGSDVLGTGDITISGQTLVSGETIKTVNGESILGAGNILVEGQLNMDGVFIPTATDYVTWSPRIVAARIITTYTTGLTPAIYVKTTNSLNVKIFVFDVTWVQLASFNFSGDTSVDQIVRLETSNKSVIFVNPSKFPLGSEDSIPYTAAGFRDDCVNHDNLNFRIYEGYNTGIVGIPAINSDVVDIKEFVGIPYVYQDSIIADREVTFGSDKLVTGNILTAELLASSEASPNFSVYLFREDATFISITHLTAVGGKVVYPITENFVSVKFYNAPTAISDFTVKASINKASSLAITSSGFAAAIEEASTNAEVANARIDAVNNAIGIANIASLSVSGEREGNLYFSHLIAGNIITAKLDACDTLPTSIDMYLFREDNTYISMSHLRAINETVTVTLLENFKYIKFYDSLNPVLSFSVTVSSIKSDSINVKISTFDSQIADLRTDVDENAAAILAANDKIGIPVVYNFATTGDREVSVPSLLLTSDKTIEVKLSSVSVSPYSIRVFLFRADGTYVNAGAMSTLDKKIVTLTETYAYVKFYDDTNNVVSYAGTLSVLATLSMASRMTGYDNAIADVEASVAENTTAVNTLKDVIGVEHTYNFNVVGDNQIEIPSEFYKVGYRLKVNFAAHDMLPFSVSSFLFRADGTYISVHSYHNVGEQFEYDLLEEFVFYKLYDNTNNTPSFSGTISLVKIDSISNQIADVKKQVITIPELLVLGDSYNQNPNIVNALKTMINVTNVVNLAVSSASMKDHQNDRNLYPYTDRPVSSNSSGNLNTISCQIEKLYRLMTGTDLDAGESKIYVTTKPSVILIAAGKNDSSDSDAEALAYINQLYIRPTNVYTTTYGSAPAIGNAVLPADISTIDRTTFAGSMRYAATALHELFPDALVFFVSPSGLGYGFGDEIFDQQFIKKTNQMKQVGTLLSIPVIDWATNGRATYLFNTPSGSGTLADPYNTTGETQDTFDSMHPNDATARRLARPIAIAIANEYRFI